jgi:release factor glutamine methyltransferase
VARVAGFRLTVRPTVFHPRYFLTSEFFANFLSEIDLTGKRVADVGTGSGILALAAARAGAASVVALDINPNAAKVAAENAHANGLGKPIIAVGSNLLSEGFLILAAASAIATALLWAAMPETMPAKYLD